MVGKFIVYSTGFILMTHCDVTMHTHTHVFICAFVYLFILLMCRHHSLDEEIMEQTLALINIMTKHGMN